MEIPTDILKQKTILQNGINIKSSKEMKVHQPALGLDEQIENLKTLGLIINDEEGAKETLDKISYFRLIKAYGVGLKPKNGAFDGTVSFEDILALYNYNTELRQALIVQIEKIEITLRCRLGNYVSETYGVLGYKNPANFADLARHKAFIKEAYDSIAYNGRSPFVRNFQENYQGQDVPFYALVEILSFGLLSKFFKNMKNPDKKVIGRSYGVNWPFLESWFETLAYVRNICAHYGRLYNIRLDKTPKLSSADKLDSSTIRVFWAIFCMKKLLPMDEHWIDFVTKLNELFLRFPQVEKEKLGFPENWQDLLTN